MNIRIPILQAILLVLISILIGIGSNILSSKPLPWFAVELSVVEDVEIKSNEPILAAISIEQAKLFFDDEVLFVDARDEGYFEAGHIKGAMKNIFLYELIFNIEEKQNKDTPLVVYCGDPGCGDSEQLAYDLKDSGFTKLYVFKGGWLEWSKAGYPSEVGK
ncbi:MAG: rhodanese-like domain-containing protein [Candidatus Marinimicrobia bacterium]|jgi:rhodanese-related sulfurtransferase|nr:rhodanese-like domain-containing protein [Candidatus Neomarinimicrobiota bacterium]MBT5441110.1 rhodanese-like domain-containing protein [Candidatus Neomarinimicrobiota bacterium]|tara:strand:+ start:473 stop:955 length:483 start_codon:yes stop_codon:yes gene_type:complete